MNAIHKRVTQWAELSAMVLLIVSVIGVALSPLLPDSALWVAVIISFDFPLCGFAVTKGVRLWSPHALRVFVIVLSGYIVSNALGLIGLVLLLRCDMNDCVLRYVGIWTTISLLIAVGCVSVFSFVATCGWIRHYRAKNGKGERLGSELEQ
jgi:hypothetical protein